MKTSFCLGRSHFDKVFGSAIFLMRKFLFLGCNWISQFSAIFILSLRTGKTVGCRSSFTWNPVSTGSRTWILIGSFRSHFKAHCFWRRPVYFRWLESAWWLMIRIAVNSHLIPSYLAVTQKHAVPVKGLPISEFPLVRLELLLLNFLVWWFSESKEIPSRFSEHHLLSGCFFVLIIRIDHFHFFVKRQVCVLL